MSAARGRRGFTLIELVIVMAIMAVGTAVVVPMVEGGFDAREVRRAARLIASAMHHCRGEAVAKGEVQTLIIAPQHNSIHTSDNSRWEVLTDRAQIERIEGGSEMDDGGAMLMFFPNGSTSGGDVVLASRRDRTRNRLRVTLDALIGSVRVEDAEL